MLFEFETKQMIIFNFTINNMREAMNLLKSIRKILKCVFKQHKVGTTYVLW